jgi:hypothetical protein
MNPEQRQQLQQTADRATVFCLISFVIGAYIIWANIEQNIPQAAGTLFPMAVIAVVHLLGGSIAIFHAVKTKTIIRNIPVYGYFLFILGLAVWVISNGGKPF